MRAEYTSETADPSGFVLLADFVPQIVQEIRYYSTYNAVTDEQFENRMFLQRAMVRNGFEPIFCEWWHFSLRDEPYPDTYFEFPVSAEYLKR